MLQKLFVLLDYDSDGLYNKIDQNYYNGNHKKEDKCGVQVNTIGLSFLLFVRDLLEMEIVDLNWGGL